jgi:hypothetical protein
VGGRWPTDGHSWKLSNDDAILFVDSGELQLFVEPDGAGRNELPIGVASAADGRRRLQVDGRDLHTLQGLPECPAIADRTITSTKLGDGGVGQPSSRPTPVASVRRSPG